MMERPVSKITSPLPLGTGKVKKLEQISRQKTSSPWGKEGISKILTSFCSLM